MNYLAASVSRLLLEKKRLGPSNTFVIHNEKGSLTCMEYGDANLDSVLVYSFKTKDGEQNEEISKLLATGKHVILTHPECAADILSVFFRLKTEEPTPIYTINDELNMVANALMKCNSQLSIAALDTEISAVPNLQWS